MKHADFFFMNKLHEIDIERKRTEKRRTIAPPRKQIGALCASDTTKDINIISVGPCWFWLFFSSFRAVSTRLFDYGCLLNSI